MDGDRVVVLLDVAEEEEVAEHLRQVEPEAEESRQPENKLLQGTPQEAEKNQLFIQLLATKKHD